MSQNVNFKLSDLPPHLRMQAERQISNDRNPRLKTPLPCARKPPAKSPLRIPQPRTPNRTEQRYVSDHPGDWRYEALTFGCPSGRYTPDWVRFNPDGTLVAVEVKGAFAYASQAAAAAKFKECAALYPAVTWIWAKFAKGNVWEIAQTTPTIQRARARATQP